MKLKSFFADSIEEAIRRARQELGPDAMLVNSKRTGTEAQHLGLYEVVVCAESTPPDAGRRNAPGEVRHSAPPSEFAKNGTVASVPAAGPRQPVARLAQDVFELKRQMEKLALTLARSGRGMASVAFDPELSRAFTALTDAEFDTDLAFDVVGSLVGRLAPGASPATLLRAELAKLASVTPELGVAGAPARIVALVGPPGAGKTSALVKLAVQAGLAAGRTVQSLTADTFRIAAADELRSYAAILGIGCQVTETAQMLAQALDSLNRPTLRSQESRENDLILIDTPGLSSSEWDAGVDLAHMLAAHPAVDTHLVLPASTRAADLRRVSDQYAIFRPRKLLFTRLDETQTFGPLLSRSIRMERPVSFLSCGQRIPEDLEPATLERLLDLVLASLAVQPPNGPAEPELDVEGPPAHLPLRWGAAAGGERAA
jgi:flagellar biosynthesis protein FlhF